MTKQDLLNVRIGNTVLKNERDAVGEIYDKIVQENMAGIIFFCSSAYDLTVLGDELKRRFPCRVIGCTSAGEISPAGYQTGGIVAASFSSTRLAMHPVLISPLSDFGPSEAKSLIESLRNEPIFSNISDGKDMFGFVLIDGMSLSEDRVIALLSHQLRWIPITGGSAGDDLHFKETKVCLDGTFYSDAALLALFETTLPFYVFGTQHFRPTDRKLVVTEADPGSRVVFEINAEPAAKAYADMIGISPEELSPRVFSNHPLMLKIGDGWYVRSIQKANEDGSLSFYSAIDRGLVLTLAEGEDMVENLKATLENITANVPDPALILGCDCILRKLEAMDKDLIKPIEAQLANTRFFGFNTYGEQIHSVHVNQTLTGVAIGKG